MREVRTLNQTTRGGSVRASCQRARPREVRAPRCRKYFSTPRPQRHSSPFTRWPRITCCIAVIIRGRYAASRLDTHAIPMIYPRLKSEAPDCRCAYRGGPPESRVSRPISQGGPAKVRPQDQALMWTVPRFRARTPSPEIANSSASTFISVASTGSSTSSRPAPTDAPSGPSSPNDSLPHDRPTDEHQA